MAIKNDERRVIVRLANLMRATGEDLNASPIGDITFLGGRFSTLLVEEGVIADGQDDLDFGTLVTEVSKLVEVKPSAKRGRPAKAKDETTNETLSEDTADETEDVLV